MNSPLLALAITLASLGDPVPELVTKTYDLSAAAPKLTGHAAERVVPRLDINRDHEGPPEQFSATDEIADWLFGTFEAEFEYEGRAFEIVGGGRVRITATPAVHKEIAGVLGFLEQSLQHTAVLRVDWIERPDGAPLLPSFVPLAEADQIVAAGQKPRTAQVQLAPGCAHTLVAARELELLVDYNVEIAQAATIADPIIHSFEIGRRSVWVGSSTRGGVQLAAFVSDSELQGAVQETTIALGGVLTTERGAQQLDDRASVQSLAVAQHVLAFNLFVPEGQAAVIEVGSDLESARSRRALVIRPSGTRKDPIASHTFNGGKSRLQIVDGTFCVTPEVRSEWDPNWLSPRSLRDLFNDGHSQSVELSSGDTSLFESSFEAFANRLNKEGNQRNLRSIGPWALVRDVGESLSEPLSMSFPSLAAVETPSSAGLSLTLRRGPRALAVWSTPIVAGGSAVFSIGGEQFAVRDADVEVAQMAATMDPYVGSRIDGILGDLHCSRAQDGSWSIAIRTRAHVLTGAAQSIDAGSVAKIPVELATAEELTLSERVVLGAPGGARKIVLGSGGELQLELELR